MDFESGGYIQIDVPKYDISFKDMDIEEEFRDEWDKFNMWDLRTKNSKKQSGLIQWPITLVKGILLCLIFVLQHLHGTGRRTSL